MQKETEILNDVKTDEVVVPRATSENKLSDKSDGSVDTSVLEGNLQNTLESTLKEDATNTDFEELIKGPYKDAFAKKVQGIINKRFKEQKMAENKSAEPSNSDKESEITEKITHSNDSTAKESNPTYDSLITAGVDPETAYRVLHLNEFMDSSMRYGAELAAKHLADSIRQKSARPNESALSQRGYTAKASVNSLTPEKRRELAKKALMGEQIGF